MLQQLGVSEMNFATLGSFEVFFMHPTSLGLYAPFFILMALLKLCAYPGCNRPVALSEKYCELHKKAGRQVSVIRWIVFN